MMMMMRADDERVLKDSTRVVGARGAWVCEGEAEARRRGGGHGRRTRQTKSRASIGLRSLSVTQDVERTLCDMFYIVVRDLLQ